MAGAIVNPHSFGAPISYEDECKADSPLGLWMLDETSGTVAVDQGSVGQNGTYMNLPSLGTRTIFGLTSSLFNSSDVVIATTPGLHTSYPGATGTMSLEWISHMDSATNFSFHVAWRQQPFQMYEQGGLINFQGTGIAHNTGFASTVGVDQHWVWTYDNANQRAEVWLNGVSVNAVTSIPGSFGNWYTSSIILGNMISQQGVYYALKGSMAGFALYSQVLSPARIAAHYAAL